ncbi:hypothetical protein [Pseudomonas sp. QTF5]|uniref:hypothetical protein n=1 Tax=Pseudomonas sp. QTF5 TaxID=1435425 RepID=UPI0004B06561|nr:hypothetical protein [Pseudomonas sp. QTF5]
MNNDTINDVSPEEILEYFKVKPRSLGWDAILCYNRKDTNTVLLQEYILRHNTDNQMEPITFQVKDIETPTYKAYIFEYRFDTPRLSFENTNIANSRAKLTSKVIGGTHVTFEMATGAKEWSVVKIGNHSPLVQTNLEMQIDLTVAKGQIDGEGRVVLDISKGIDNTYTLQYNDTDDMRKTEGAEFQKAFARLPVEIREWELNRVEVDPTHYLQPQEFYIRTHQPVSARVKGASNAEEGAVLVFITMKGGKNGTTPVTDADLPYLIPDGHSATLVLGHKFLMEKIITEGCKGIINTEDEYKIELEGPEEGFTEKLTVTDGSRRTNGFGVDSVEGLTSFELVELVLGLGKQISDILPGDSQFYMDFKDNKLKLTWTGDEKQPVNVVAQSGTNYKDPIGTRWAMVREFTFELDESGSLRMVVNPEGDELAIRVTPEEYVKYEDVSPYFEGIHGAVHPKLLAELNESMTAFLNMSKEIDIFRLNSLLFRNENSVKLQRAEFPGDVVTFGQVGPTLTAFTIDHDLPEWSTDRLEPMIGVGQTLKFVTVPSVDATWSVENIDGNTGETGTIDPATGVYVAPSKDQFEGRFLRVRVNAVQGENTSSALVSVLVDEMDFAPQIQIVGAGSAQGRALRAGALGGETLTWSVSAETAARGGRVEPVPEGEEGDHIFYVGPHQEGTLFTVDEVIVTNSIGRSQSSYLLVHHVPALLTIGIEQELPDNKIKIAMMGPDGPIVQLPEYPWKWTVPIGAGTIDEMGVVTYDPDGALPFIIVTLEVPPQYPGQSPSTAFKLLPIPLFTVPETLRLLRD